MSGEYVLPSGACPRSRFQRDLDALLPMAAQSRAHAMAVFGKLNQRELPADDLVARATALPAPLVIHEMFRVVAAERGDAIAIKHRGEAPSYRELDRRSDALAAAIHRAGVAPGATIAMTAVRSTDAIVAMLSILKAGYAYVPIDEAYPEAVVRDYLTRSGAAAIVLADHEQPPAPRRTAACASSRARTRRCSTTS
jgi:non-ribosomal peptide synthetase component F